jgi:hypothetical protein
MLHVKSVKPTKAKRQHASFHHELLALSEEAVWGKSFRANTPVNTSY